MQSKRYPLALRDLGKYELSKNLTVKLYNSATVRVKSHLYSLAQIFLTLDISEHLPKFAGNACITLVTVQSH